MGSRINEASTVHLGANPAEGDNVSFQGVTLGSRILWPARIALAAVPRSVVSIVIPGGILGESVRDEQVPGGGCSIMGRRDTLVHRASLLCFGNTVYNDTYLHPWIVLNSILTLKGMVWLGNKRNASPIDL